MSLKAAFAEVLRAMRSSRGLTQAQMAETSSRTYLSKLERGQSSLTVDKLDSLSRTFGLSPLTLIAVTLGAGAEASLEDLRNRLDAELLDLEHSGVLGELGLELTARMKTTPSRMPAASRSASAEQGELQFNH